MRIRINLKLSGKSIVANYKHYLQSLIYNTLKKNNKYESLHNEGYKIENRPFKLFVISDILGKFEYVNNNKYLLFKTDAYFELAAIDEEIIVNVIEYLNINNYLHINKTIVEHDGYSIQSIKYPQNCDEFTFTSISPVTCYRVIDGETIYYEPESLEFRDMILGNLEKKMKLIYGDDNTQVEIKSILNKRKRLVHFKNTFIIAFDIDITFSKLNKDFFEVILLTGLGPKNSMGFGMMRY